MMTVSRKSETNKKIIFKLVKKHRNNKNREFIYFV